MTAGGTQIWVLGGHCQAAEDHTAAYDRAQTLRGDQGWGPVAHGDQDRKKEREQLRERLLGQGCTYGQIATAMTRQFGDRPRPAWRHAYGWTQDQVAALFNEMVGDPNASMIASRISDFENWPKKGRAKPTIPTLGVLASIYATKVSKLVDPHDLRNMDPKERILLGVLDSGIIPRQLPSTISNFVGRVHELGILNTQLGRVGDGGMVVWW